MPTTASSATGHEITLGIEFARYHRRLPSGERPLWPTGEAFSFVRLARAVDQSSRKYGVVNTNATTAAPTPAAMPRTDAPGTSRRRATMPAVTNAARRVTRK